MRIGPKAALAVCDPGLTRQLLLDDRTFDKGGPFYDKAKEAVGDGLVTCPYSAHRRQRRLVQPAFHSSRLPAYARVMTEQTSAVTTSWRDGQIFDVYVEMKRITAHTLVATMFSNTVDSTELTEMFDDINLIREGIFSRTVKPSLLNALPTRSNRRYLQARARLQRAMARIIAEHRSGGGGDHSDGLLSVLLSDAGSPGNSQSRRLTDTEINDQLRVFFIAGIETTAATPAWALHLLARHPHAEQHLHAEVDRVLDGAAATHGDLPDLRYTSHVVDESLRLYPPGWLFTRTTTSDTSLGGHPVRAGTTVVYSPCLIHHRADLYDDPERFDPDRWEETHRRSPSHHAFIPFGGGARKCIGDRFGLTEAIIALATIASAWRLEPLPGRRVRPALASTLSPQGLQMRARARTHPEAIRKQACEPRT
ncbi:cytochrome P450 [Streptomyces fumigatiscleroticus]|nr:cytochrome P450 [Streptomyces fumigatiscleroticus]